jgi:hypothetical protein
MRLPGFGQWANSHERTPPWFLRRCRIGNRISWTVVALFRPWRVHQRTLDRDGGPSGVRV